MSKEAWTARPRRRGNMLVFAARASGGEAERKPAILGGMEALAGIRYWGLRRHLAALGAGIGWLMLSGVPTDIVDTPLFTRMTPVAWWNYPFWVAGAVLVGLLAATYVTAAPDQDSFGGSQGAKALGGGLLSVFAIGCPVCNKLVVLALGAGGALSYFAPIQPVLGFISVGLLAYALRVRLTGERSCRPVNQRGAHDDARV
jgi:hypothetical protein